MPRDTEKITQGGTTLAVVQTSAERLPKQLHLIGELLTSNGAVLLRGLHLGSVPDFHASVRLFAPPLESYRGGNTPRKTLSAGVFTSTEYPPRYEISLHNELSYASQWPQRLYFSCLRAAATGGATPICDGRAILSDLAPEVRGRFEQLGVTYVQNLHGGNGLGKSWQATFETDDRASVESFLIESQAAFSWTASGGLKVSQTRDGLRKHPVTGEPVWFNQAEQWHPSNLPAELAKAMLSLVNSPDELAHWVTFGDGSPISDADFAAVREASRRNRLAQPWQPGDLLVIDNLLVQHGREPFTGERQVIVAMT